MNEADPTGRAPMPAATLTLGAAVRDRRLDLGLTQRDLGRRVRSSPSLVGRWERGSVVPSAGSVARLAEALGLDLSELLRLRREALT